MKKVLLTVAVVMFLMVGNAMAFQMTITDSANYDKGEIVANFTDSDMVAEWVYCVQEDETINWDTPYDYTLVDVSAYPSVSESYKGYSAAWLIYVAYGHDPAQNTLSLAAQQTLQTAIWDVFNNNNTAYISFYAGFGTMLSNMFDIVITAGTDVQDMIVYNPENPGTVPVPGAGLLLSIGLVGLIGLRRKDA